MFETLGINPLSLIAQIISFGIVYFILSRFVFPPVRKALDERRAAVSKTFEDQAAIEARLLEFDKEQKARQKEAQEEIQRMLAEAKDSAALIKKDLVAKAQEAANAEFALAQKRIEQERISAEAEVATYAKSIAQSIVQEILYEKANDPRWQQAQVEASINALKQN
jgi:F-type H+-transporting ATPase subunit b